MKTPKSFAGAIPDQDRLTTAKERADHLVDHIASLFTMHEANRFVIYSDVLAKQIPPSYAAHAFNQFQQSMHLFELVRLCALWDKPAKDRESIPTIMALIDKTEIVESLIASTHRYYANEVTAAYLNPSTDPQHHAAYQAWWDEERKRRADEEAAKVRTWLIEARTQADTIQASPELAALRNFRDSYIAHNLRLPEPSLNSPATVHQVKYGDETRLLEQTVKIADNLHLALNGTSFDWDGSREIAENNARDLWEACQFVGIGRRRRQS